MEIFLIFLVLLFGALTLYFSFREEKLRKTLKEQDKLQKQKIYEVSILKEIQDRIGYSLDVSEIIDVITGSLRHLFPYSSVSSLTIKDDKLILKTYVEEPVSKAFIDSVKESMVASFQALLPVLPKTVDEIVTGVPLDGKNSQPLASFFHIPLIVRNRVVGLINISSTTPNLYKEDEMTILYQITAQASSALSKLEEVLETEKGKLTSMIASLADGVFMLDQKRQLVIINESAKSFLAIEKPNASLFDVISPLPSGYNLVEKIETAEKSNQTLEEKEIKIGEKTFQLFITPVKGRDAEQKYIGTSILLHDITLEKNLAELKEDFTNMMVHELRAPLTAVKDSSELILESNKLTKEETDNLLKIINNQAKMLLEQIGLVLDAAKIEAGRFVITKSLGDVGSLIDETVKTFLPVASKKNILLTSQIDPLPKISFDANHLREVLNNLLSNSLKFTNKGGKIKITAQALKSYIQISVSDTGIGIPQDKQKDVFQKFFRVEKTGAIGTGLGLYIVKGIVEAHKGKVGLVSEEGKGTTVTFTLPITEDSSFEKVARPYKTLN
jgi:two-component system, OmpR family, phosphate regulon sensor histidine kinase PhoR